MSKRFTYHLILGPQLAASPVVALFTASSSASGVGTAVAVAMVVVTVHAEVRMRKIVWACMI
jgi:hypothetical protein